MFLIIFSFMFFVNFIFADIIPENSHKIGRCVKIKNNFKDNYSIIKLKSKIKKETPQMLNRWKTRYQALTKNAQNGQNAQNDTKIKTKLIKHIFRPYASKMDIYGLGGAIFGTLQVNFEYSRKNRDLVYWWENNFFYKSLCQLLQEMLEPDPKIRISPTKALERFDELNKICKMKVKYKK